MFSKIRSKHKDLNKSIRAAVKEDFKIAAQAARTQEFYDNSAHLLENNNFIDSDLYVENNVKRGLRNANGTGVLVGLTRIGNVVGYDVDENKNKIPREGTLYYRGYNIEDLVNNCVKEQRFGFEEITYLLIFGELPSKSELEYFKTFRLKT